MNELVSVPISPWYTIPAAVGLLTLTFVFAPGVLLHLGVLLFPKGHERREQFTADLYDVPYVKRPFWVASTLVRCLFEGTPARIQSVRSRRAARRQSGPRPDLDLGDDVRIPAPSSVYAPYLEPVFVLTSYIARRSRFFRNFLRWSFMKGYRRGEARASQRREGTDT